MASMNVETLYISVMMIRAKLEPSELESVLGEARALSRPALLFFHSDAVCSLSDPTSPWLGLCGEPGLDLAYCVSAWQRRDCGEAPKGVQASTLIRFWDARLRSWQADGDDKRVDAPVAVSIRQVRDELGWQETLEVLLAAATLDIPLAVRFEAEAWASLISLPKARAAWQQLLDFELASLQVIGAPADERERSRGIEFLSADRHAPNSRSGLRLLEV